MCKRKHDFKKGEKYNLFRNFIYIVFTLYPK